MTEQQALRREKQAKRRQLSAHKRLTLSENIAARLTATPTYRHAKHIGCYLAFGAEVETAAIVEKIWRDNKTCYLPRLSNGRENRLRFMPFNASTSLTRNRFGIYEPQNNGAAAVNLLRLDLVIVPLVAFDSTCNRIGMGGGFYDRSFQFRRSRTHWTKPILAGVAFDCQRVPAIEGNSWDVRLDYVITESTIYSKNERP